VPDDIGENLVGSYLRYVEGCQFVIFNTQYPGVQGEIDVIGLKLLGERRMVWFCEVVTHIQGVSYGTYDRTITKLDEKLRRARDFAASMFPHDVHRYEVWSPVVPTGYLTKAFLAMEQRYNDDDLDLHFVINEPYAARVQTLVEHARRNPAATSEPAYRLLQILTRLKGTITI
jgi:Holliday junction resolvase-like predicted endonuclease